MKRIPDFYMPCFKKIITGVVIVSIASFSACDKDSLKDFFMLGSVKKVQSETLEELEEKAHDLEDDSSEETGTGEKLGIIYQKIGDKYLQRKTWTSAIGAYEKAIGFGRDSSVIHYSVAVAYANRGRELQKTADINKAEFHYKRAVEISPDNYRARYGLGILYAYAKDDKAKGLKVLKDLNALNRNYFDARFAIGRIYYELGEKRKSLSTYEDLYSDLKQQKKSPQMDEYIKNCKLNIERLMVELAGSR